LSVVALDNLSEGVVLNADVRDSNGRLILSRGKRIDAAHIRLFRIWGVPEVNIEGTHDNTTAPDTGEENINKRVKAEHTVEMVCQCIDVRHPAIAAIVQAAVEYRYRNDLLIAFGAKQPLSEKFKLNLSSGIETQVQFAEVQLPESPEIVAAYHNVIANPMSSANDIADVVNRSPSLTALLLKIANSPLFGFMSRVDTISRAVTLLGTREIGELVTGISIMRVFRDIPAELIDMPTFLRHSLACGILSRILAARKNLKNTERLFVAGLLHDIGRLIWYRYFPEQAKLSLYMAKRTGLPLYEIEEECLGINHGQMAGYLLTKWELPPTLANTIVYHHRPSRSPNTVEAGIVHMADIAINALGLGHSGEHIIARFEHRMWDRLDIAPQALVTAIGQTIEQLDIMQSLFVEL
jgi:putative nucleotidyltransferase with HDIG domain